MMQGAENSEMGGYGEGQDPNGLGGFADANDYSDPKGPISQWI
jgi:hypothetical protein